MSTFATGDWFAIPLRFGLFAVGRAAAVDRHGAFMGYFFDRFFERLPEGPHMLGFSPGDAAIIGVCDARGVRGAEWTVVATARTCDPRPWPVPVFRTIDERTGNLQWLACEPNDLRRASRTDSEPPGAGTRNWGLPMTALVAHPMSPAEVEAELFRRFRVYQNQLHRKYIADMQRSIASRAS